MRIVKSMMSVALLFFVLIGCATVGDYQSECEKIHSNFSDMTTCLKQKVDADPRANTPANQPFVKRYLLEAEKLSQLVKKKKISDIDARIQLSELYLNLRNTQLGEKQVATQNWQTQQIINNMRRPVSTNCHGVGHSVNCTTY